MIDFKKAITFAYDNVKWYYLLLLLVLAIAYVVGDVLEIQALSSITIFLVMLLGAGILGTKISGKLKTLKQSTVNILKNTGIYAVISIIYLIAQMILIVIGIAITAVVVDNYNSFGSLTDPSNLEALFYTMPVSVVFALLLFAIVFVIALLIIEIIKTMGIVKYFKTNKFEDAFKIGKYFKAVFTKDYLTIIFYIVGFATIAATVLIVISAIVGLFSETIALAIISLLAIILMYTALGMNYSLFADYILDKK